LSLSPAGERGAAVNGGKGKQNLDIVLSLLDQVPSLAKQATPSPLNQAPMEKPIAAAIKAAYLSRYADRSTQSARCKWITAKSVAVVSK
jgi:hypothetical protein